jgi:tetratricopeptide (TPR) repeat protein
VSQDFPRRLGPYVVEKLLGRGAMGAVLLVRHEKLGARYALKMVSDSGLDAEGLRRFEREAQALARLNHPNIVRIHASGTEGNRPYYVMDLLEGRPLDALITEQGVLDPWVAARIGSQLASALGAAHAQKILHRDMKPANVILEDGGERAVLCDFGLASAPRDNLTRTGDVLGTPAYMSPEQALGHRDRQGPATDIYGLGALLYKAVTGSTPIGGSSSSAVDALRQVIEGKPLPPGKLRPGVPPELEAIIMRCLEKEPARRFSDAASLGRALDAFAAKHRPDEVLAPEPASSRLPIVLALVAFLSVIATGALVVSRQGKPRDVAPVATATAAGTPAHGEDAKAPVPATEAALVAAADGVWPSGDAKALDAALEARRLYENSLRGAAAHPAPAARLALARLQLLEATRDSNKMRKLEHVTRAEQALAPGDWPWAEHLAAARILGGAGRPDAAAKHVLSGLRRDHPEDWPVAKELLQEIAPALGFEERATMAIEAGEHRLVLDGLGAGFADRLRDLVSQSQQSVEEARAMVSQLRAVADALLLVRAPNAQSEGAVWLVEASTEGGPPWHRRITALSWGLALLDQNELEAAAETLEQARSPDDELDVVGCRFTLALARIRALRKDFAGAAELVARVLASSPTAATDHAWALRLTNVDLALERGDPDAAEKLLGSPEDLDPVALQLLRAKLHAVRAVGSPAEEAEALHLLEIVAGSCDLGGARLLAIATRLRQARLEWSLGRKSEARAYLERARRIDRTSGGKPLRSVAEAEKLMAE